MKYPCISLFVLLTIAQILSYTSAEQFDECDGMPDESFVASWYSCNTYIYCSGEDSQQGECEEGEYFDGDAGACDDASLVFCAFDQIEEEEEPEPEPEVEVESEPEPVPEPVREEPITSRPLAETTTTANLAAASNTDPLNIPHVVRASCPAMDDPKEITLTANSQSCSDYYLCYHGNAIEMRCTNQLHFNVNTGKCDFPEKVQCAIDRPNANKCLPHITDFFPHPEKCNYFYYCIKGFLTVQQCPFYYGWDIERRSCVQMSQAKCYENAKRT